MCLSKIFAPENISLLFTQKISLDAVAQVPTQTDKTETTQQSVISASRMKNSDLCSSSFSSFTNK